MSLSRTAAAVLSAAALTVSMLVSGAAPGSARDDRDDGPARGPSYQNAISDQFADTFADPAVIRGKDGLWYAYGTSDPLREGEGTFHRIPMARSADLVDWTYLGDAFSDATVPGWAAPGASIWAPDVRHVDGEWRMYYVVTETTVTDRGGDNAIGMATAPTPAGPWTDTGAPVVAPREGNGGFLWTFDPSVVTDRDGSQWIFYGSYNGGMFVAPLDPTGRRVSGPERMVAIDNKFEGAYVVQRGGWWYLFASTANCCAGPATGYSVQVGRSQDLRGPYLDREGVPLTASRAGGTPVLVQNGNRWIGAGHNAVATDVAGQDWIVYHAIDPADPYLDGTSGINERPMLMDRLDWVDGWPAVRAGAGPSDDRQRGPVTAGTTALRTSALGVLSARAVRAPVRVEGDLRGAAGLGALLGRRDEGVRAELRPAGNVLALTAGSRRDRVEVTAPLPAGFDHSALHSVVLQVRDGVATAEVSHARLGDPVAELSVSLPRPLRHRAGRAGALTPSPGAEAANVTVARPAVPVEELVEEEVPSRPVPSAGDEFDAGAPAAGWTWLREDPQATVEGGALRWPTQAADLVGSGNDAAVLLRDPPDRDDWAVETKVSIDLGTDTVRNFQQAGLIVHASDDLFTRLSHVAIWNTRQTEFGKELPYAGGTSFGGTIIGPPAETTWLRITHRRDEDTGEHELRGWTSRDGRSWVKGGVWTLPADADLRVGLISHGGAGATARFDWFRTYR